MASYLGNCHCGGIQFVVEGPPKSVMYCHCSICRKSTGGPFIIAAVWKPDDCKVDGELIERATSSYLTRYRCAGCGAAIYNAVRTDKFSANNFMLPLLESATDLRPTHHIYYADRVVDIDDGLPKFDAFGRP